METPLFDRNSEPLVLPGIDEEGPDIIHFTILAREFTELKEWCQVMLGVGLYIPDESTPEAWNLKPDDTFELTMRVLDQHQKSMVKLAWSGRHT